MRTNIEKYRLKVSRTISILFFLIVIFSEVSRKKLFLYETLEIIGYVLVVVATLGRIWCAIYISGKKDEELVQDGPYSISRNPLYLFSFSGVIGLILGTQILFFLLIIIPVFCIYFYLVIKSEEDRLKALFGQEYVDYSLKVNRFFPNFKNFWTRKNIEINPNILIRSIANASCFIWLLLFLELLESLKSIELNGRNVFPILWNMPF